MLLQIKYRCAQRIESLNVRFVSDNNGGDVSPEIVSRTDLSDNELNAREYPILAKGTERSFRLRTEWVAPMGSTPFRAPSVTNVFPLDRGNHSNR